MNRNSGRYGTAGVFRGESFAFQLFYQVDAPWSELRFEVEAGDLPIRLFHVETMPARRTGDDPADGMPGLYPEILQPAREPILSCPGQAKALWISVDVPESIVPGEHRITLCMNVVRGGKSRCFRRTFRLKVLPPVLPAAKLRHTEWLHVDSLCHYYQTEVWSERCWEVLEYFIEDQVRHGINMLMTPIFTPPMDTEQGGERPTVQLLEISCRNAQYHFDFSRLERWVDLALAQGIHYFEMPPLFTQWGAAHAPKIVVNGEVRFGWHTEAQSEEYAALLAALLPALFEWFEERGLGDRVYFHISDEPAAAHRRNYEAAAAIFRRYANGRKSLDALSDPRFFRNGSVGIPVIPTDVFDRFAEEDLPERWCYYTGGQQKGVSNRLLHFPPERNRIFGMHLFRMKIDGFLHWGHNFYWTRLSRSAINPWVEMEAGGTYPAGDAFWVYPGADGHPVSSIRYELFGMAQQDLRALQLLEKLIGRDQVEQMLDRLAGGRMDFNSIAISAKELLAFREKINRSILKNI